MPPLADLLKCPRHHAAHTLRPRFDAFCLFLFELPRLLSERDVQDALCCLLDKSYSKLLGASSVAIASRSESCRLTFLSTAAKQNWQQEPTAIRVRCEWTRRSIEGQSGLLRDAQSRLPKAAHCDSTLWLSCTGRFPGAWARAVSTTVSLPRRGGSSFPVCRRDRRLVWRGLELAALACCFPVSPFDYFFVEPLYSLEIAPARTTLLHCFRIIRGAGNLV